MAEQGSLSGQTVGNKYLLGELLGEGGFGAVYKAHHLHLQRQQAVKILLERHFQKQEFRERFLREAQTVAALDHPNVIHTEDFWVEPSRAYLVMPFIKGGTFQDILRKQQKFLELEQIVFYLEHICAALDYAHVNGVVHLDLKPLNLLVHNDGRLLLADFGLAHLMKQGVVAGGSSLLFGTPHYMAPEHVQGRPEKRSDLFSLGVILYQMLVGRLPFEGLAPEAIMIKNLMEWPPAPRTIRPNLPQGVEDVVAKALAKQPEQRYQAAGDLLAAFKRALLVQPSVPAPVDSARRSRVVLAFGGANRLLYTALDIGMAYAKAMIVEVVEDVGVVLGVGRYPQSYGHMSDGIVTDIPGVIANCNEALLRAKEAAGGVIAPNTVIGIAGELVKGSSTTVTQTRRQPGKVIAPEELVSLISRAQQKLLKAAKERISAETGYLNIEVRLVSSWFISVNIDGLAVSNPIGFRGQHFTLTLFSAFAPLMQLNALQTVVQGLDLSLMATVAEPYALASCLRSNASEAIVINIGAGTTDITLVRQVGIEETRMFALGGRTFTRRLVAHKGLPWEEAEKLKLNYSLGHVKEAERDEIQKIFASEAQTWMDSVELLVEELAKGDLLPPAVYIGGSCLPDLEAKLESYPWTERLPFSHKPIIQTIQPGMVTSISDPDSLLKNAQDITLMALAYHVLELQNRNSVLEQALFEANRLLSL